MGKLKRLRKAISKKVLDDFDMSAHLDELKQIGEEFNDGKISAAEASKRMAVGRKRATQEIRDEIANKEKELTDVHH